MFKLTLTQMVRSRQIGTPDLFKATAIKELGNDIRAQT